MIIRKDQIDELRAAQEPEFAHELVRHLRTFHAPAVAERSDTTLYRLVRVKIREAHEYDLERSEDVAAFVALCFQISLNFHRQPAINAILLDPATPPERKIDRLNTEIIDSEWDEAQSL